jgi:hypothetical protein
LTRACPCAPARASSMARRLRAGRTASASRVGFMFKGRSSLIEIVPDRIFDLDPRAKPWFADGIKAAS